MGTRPARPTYKTNFLALEERRKNPSKDLTKSEALDEMKQWIRDIQYKPNDLDRLNVVHVAGTKGKGTTCAYVNSILSKYHDRYNVPHKVGLYTSPHLLSVCERIRVNNRPISEESFTKYFFEVWDRLEDAAEKRGADKGVKPAYFRFLTLLCFHVFVQEHVDVAILEVGVGGEFDSTNVVAKPAVTGITSLGIDHVRVLGGTIEEIAWHKAGIFKADSPAYTVWQPEGAMEVLKRKAEDRGVALSQVPIARCLRNVQITPDEDFQKRNASLAIALAAQALERLGISDLHAQDSPQTSPNAPNGDRTFDLFRLSNGSKNNESFDLDRPLPDLFKTGLASTVWRGRGETVERDYGKWLIDGAHTTDSLEIVGDWFGRTVKKAAAELGKKKPLCILVFNQQASGRDAKLLIDTLQQTLSQRWGIKPSQAIFCTNVTYKNRGYKLDFVDENTNPDIIKGLTVQTEYADIWRQNDPEGTTTTTVMSSIEEAVLTARNLCAASPDQPAYILATGSFRLIGGVLTILEGEGIATEPSSSI